MSSSRAPITDLAAVAGSWTLDPGRTTIEIRTKAMWVIPTKATARALHGGGSIDLDGGFSGTLVVDASSLDTKNKKRDAHLRSADFFEVETYPTITYTVTGGRVTSSGDVEVSGELTVHGTTRPLQLLADVDVTGDSAEVTARADIDRSDWGLTLTPFGAGLKNRVVVRAHFEREVL